MVLKTRAWLWLALLACIASSASAGFMRTQYVSDIIRDRGFDVDEYDVISEGYDLKVYRIINPLADPATLHPVPVICSHGITFDMSNMLSSSTWSRPRKPIVNERVTLYSRENGTDDRSLYFYLANNNYDVWLIEARATNTQNRRRSHERAYASGFWDFSLDQQALFDLPRQIEFVLFKTGQPKAGLITYSQSTTLAFAMLSMRPEYEEKLATLIAVGPVVFTNYMNDKFTRDLPIRGMILLKGTGATAYAPVPVRKLSNALSTFLCSTQLVRNVLCKKGWQFIMGKGLGSDIEGTMASNAFKSTSLKTFEQYLRNHYLRDFRMFDYKDEGLNYDHYGQTVPPVYNVSKITLKSIVLFRGTDDKFSTGEDQMLLIAKLRVPLYEDHILEDYNHFDYMLSPTVTRDVNEPILRCLDALTNRKVDKVSHTLGLFTPEPGSDPVELDADTDRKLGLLLTSVQGSAALEADAPKLSAQFDGVHARPTSPSIDDQLSGTTSP